VLVGLNGSEASAVRGMAVRHQQYEASAVRGLNGSEASAVRGMPVRHQQYGRGNPSKDSCKQGLETCLLQR